MGEQCVGATRPVKVDPPGGRSMTCSRCGRDLEVTTLRPAARAVRRTVGDGPGLLRRGSVAPCCTTSSRECRRACCRCGSCGGRSSRSSPRSSRPRSASAGPCAPAVGPPCPSPSSRPPPTARRAARCCERAAPRWRRPPAAPRPPWQERGLDAGRAEIFDPRSRTPRRTRGPSGPMRASRATAGSDAPTRWSPTSRWAPAGSTTPSRTLRARSRRQLLRHRARLLRHALGARARRGDEGAARQGLPRHQVLRRRRPSPQRHAGAEDHRSGRGQPRHACRPTTSISSTSTRAIASSA